MPQDASADAWAGMLATKLILERQGKEVLAVSSFPIPKNLSFLGMKDAVYKEILRNGDFIISINTEENQVDRIKYTMEETSVDILVTPKSGTFSESDVSCRQSVGEFDCAIGFDVPNAENLGPVFEDNTELFASIPVVNVSTNPAFDTFGKLLLVFPEKSSICEIVHDSFQAFGFSDFSEPIASILLTGIIASTSSFLDRKTTSSGLELASALQSQGAKQSDIIDHLFKHKSLLTLKIWGSILQSLQMDANHRIAWASIGGGALDELGGSIQDVELINQDILRFLNGVDVVSLVIETPEQTKVEVRTDQSAIDLEPLLQLTDQYVWRESGIDLFFPVQKIEALQEQVLQSLAGIQKQRLRIDAEVEIERYEIPMRSSEEQKPEFSQIVNTVEKNLSPEAPKNIPFELSESEAGVSEIITKSVEEEGKDEPPLRKSRSDQPNKPKWLK